MTPLQTLVALIGLFVTLSGIVSAAIMLVVRATRWTTTLDDWRGEMSADMKGVLERLDRGAEKIHTQAEMLAALPCRQTRTGSCPDIATAHTTEE